MPATIIKTTPIVTRAIVCGVLPKRRREESTSSISEADRPNLFLKVLTARLAEIKPDEQAHNANDNDTQTDKVEFLHGLPEWRVRVWIQVQKEKQYDHRYAAGWSKLCRSSYSVIIQTRKSVYINVQINPETPPPGDVISKNLEQNV